MAKFKAGDRVYCPEIDAWRHHRQGIDKGWIYAVFDHEDKIIVASNEATLQYHDISEHGKCPCLYAQRAFHATPENKAALETLYGMEFEDVI